VKQAGFEWRFPVLENVSFTRSFAWNPALANRSEKQGENACESIGISAFCIKISSFDTCFALFPERDSGIAKY